MKIVARLSTTAVAAILFAVAPPIVHGQELGNPLPGLSLDGLNTYAPPPTLNNMPGISAGTLTLAAQLTAEGPEITRGLTWRVFSPAPGPDGKLPLKGSAQGGTATFDLEPGSYLVHAAFGRAGATKRITVGAENKRETLVLDAGGLKLDAMLSGGVRIPPGKLRFSIYEADEDINGDRALVVPNVKPNTVVRLNAGTYHVVSQYGNVNAVIRSDIRVEAGKLTEALVEHKAAQITMKLVREKNGEAIADTSWSVLTESGDIVKEKMVGAFASMVLAEGKYSVVAKNRDRIYQREFQVEAGHDDDVEVNTETNLASAKPELTGEEPLSDTMPLSSDEFPSDDGPID
ncbi:MAG: hypothetical protein M9939_25710 [Mesorhizobium sp.]|nr:hypothetical protein [Mesorhizobium sp.]MCO5164491.1 hypothetical protein [Mesorhizobium sp.]